jgi:hypothetical protein
MTVALANNLALKSLNLGNYKLTLGSRTIYGSSWYSEIITEYNLSIIKINAHIYNHI